MFGAMDYYAVQLGGECAPVQLECADFDRAARRALGLGNNSFPEFFAQPVAARDEKGGNRQKHQDHSDGRCGVKRKSQTPVHFLFTCLIRFALPGRGQISFHVRDPDSLFAGPATRSPVLYWSVPS